MVKFNFTVQQAAEHTGVPFVPDGRCLGITTRGRGGCSSMSGFPTGGATISVDADTRWSSHYTSGPITAIWIDPAHGSFWGAASNFGED